MSKNLEAMEVGFLGLGIMGTAMARNLLKKGFKVTVWNRSPAKASIRSPRTQEWCERKCVFLCLLEICYRSNSLYSRSHRLLRAGLAELGKPPVRPRIDHRMNHARFPRVFPVGSHNISQKIIEPMILSSTFFPRCRSPG